MFILGEGIELIKTHAHQHWTAHPKIRMLRTEKREGLIRAKVWGAHKATGEVSALFCLANAQFWNMKNIYLKYDTF